jgi:putative alpha-1,2-mannosidase
VNSSVEAKPGYFALSLNTSVKAEMTVSNHTALYRFTFPEKAVPMKASDKGDIPNEPLILVDLTDLQDTRTNGSVSVDAGSGRITGSGTFAASFGFGTYTAYFCADFSGADMMQNGIFQNTRASTEPKSLKTYADGVDSPPVPAGGFVQFKQPHSNNQVLARVGVSLVSSDQACKSAEKEIPKFDFDATHSSAEDAWRTKFSAVELDNTGINSSIQTTFWSGMYRAMISPQDYTGENPLWESSEPCKKQRTW